jgi:pyruvate formate lyase activating enzyme
VSRFVDLFLYDLKTLDDRKHKEYTGVSNELIVANLIRLAHWKSNVIIRVPVIPGVNDQPEEIQTIGSFLASLGTAYEIQLLPYHETGAEKYRRLGLDYRMQRTRPPSQDKMEELATDLRSRVSLVSIGG